jgi:hypothetical protein
LLQPQPPHLQTIDEPSFRSLPMQPPNSTPVPASLICQKGDLSHGISNQLIAISLPFEAAVEYQM